MLRRIVPLLLALLAIALVAGAGRAAPPPPGTYLARGDQRLCASPRCGGWWLTRVGAPRTTCLDGTTAAACYVTRVTGSRPSELGLVRGTLAPDEAAGDGLALLVADASWAPVGPGPPRGAVFRVHDLGVRCIAAPCFSLAATRVGRPGRTTLSGLDLRAVVRGDQAGDDRIREELVRGRVLVAGVIRLVPHAGPAGDGRVLVASQVWR